MKNHNKHYYKPILSFIIGFLYTISGVAQNNISVNIIPLGDNQCNTYNMDGEYVILNDQLIKTCKGNEATYVATGQNLTNFTWTVTGGNYSLSANNSQCTVTWGQGDLGVVEVTATNSSGDECSDRLEVILEDNPKCRSTSVPAYFYDLSNPDRKDLYVCLGDSITFIDNSYSTTTPIVGYYWDSPWGTSSSNTYSFTAQTIGDNYKITHKVFNECGCYDSEIIYIHVAEACSTQMNCYGTVCAHTTVDYHVSLPSCTYYTWDVDGGTLVSGQGTQYVRVAWNAPESGYGTLTLDESRCNCECKTLKAIKIPVISDAVPISGPDVICKDQPKLYSLPLWGGTGYHWSVSPATNVTILTADSTNEALIQISQTGTYTITATYECRFLNCGPYQVSKVISVKDNLEIIDPTSNIVCQNETVQFSSNATTASQWEVFQNGQKIDNSATPSVTFNYTFSQCGIFTVKATNPDFCNTAEKTIEVVPLPPAPTYVSGPHEICPNSSEYYSTTAPGPDYYILWEWNNDNGTATATGERVMITFGSTASDIYVYQVDRRTGCRSTPLVWHTYLFQFGLWPYNSPIKVCEGEQFQLNLLPDHPDVPVLYVWTPLPEQALSVVGDHLQRNVTVQANFCDPAVSTAYMILERKACNIPCTDSVTVLLGQIDPPAVNLGPFCANIHVQLNGMSDDDRLNADQNLSYWTINGVGTVYGIPADIVFPSAGTYSGTLHYVSRYGCEVQVPLSNIQVNAFPALSLTTSGGNLCLTGLTLPDLNYTCFWTNGITNQQYIPLPIDDIYCTVCSNVNSCCTTLHYVPPLPECTQASGFSCINPCYNIVTISVNNNVTLPATLNFYCGTTLLTQSVRITSPSQNVLIPQPCVDRLKLNWSSGDTRYCDSQPFGPISPSNDWLNFKINSDCNGNIIITDMSTYSSTPWPTRSVTVTNSNTSAFMSDSFLPANRELSFPALNSINTPCEFRISITIDNNSSCSIEYLQTFDPVPNITSINIPPLCDQTPALLSATAIGTGLEYLWHFGDGSSNYGENIYHTYSVSRPSANISLTVTDRNGCHNTQGQTKTISSNNIRDNRDILGSTDPICYGDTKIMYYKINNNNNTFNSDIFSWVPSISETSSFPAIKNYALYAGGDYRVLETNPTTGCKGEATANIKYPNEIPANILCDDAYCQGEVALAFGNAGNQYHYHWDLVSNDNTPLDNSTDANYRFTVPQDVSCTLNLAVSENNCTTSTAKTILIHPLPNAPTISFGNNACISDGPVQLTALPSYPYLLWSNGTQGFSTTYYTDGPAAAYYIDNNGCHSPLGGITIPRAPNFDGLLTGCYTVCANSNSRTAIYSLGVAYNTPWTWYRDGYTSSYGTVPHRPSSIQLSMPSIGTYRLRVNDYGQGCYDVSPPLTLSPIDCSPSIGGGSIPLNQRISCAVSKLYCSRDKCGVNYSGEISLRNLSTAPITVTSISGNPAIPITLSPALPVTLLAGGTSVISFTFTYDFSVPPSVTYTLYDNTGQPVGSVTIDLSNSIGCLNPDECEFDIGISLNLNSTLSSAGQAIYFDFTCTCSNPNATILKIWCDGPGEIVSAPMGSFPCTGTLMIGYGRLTQMVADTEEFCFHILCCIDDEKTCLKYVCIPAYTLSQQCPDPPQNGKQYRFKPIGNAGNESAGTRYRLSPNPTSGKVIVTDVTTNSQAHDIEEVAVLSLLGTPILVQTGGGQFDISALPQGSYMVKITNRQGLVEHLRLVKGH